MDRQKGFSLIELLIVVAIILVIAAIAIPNLVRARIAANEASAVNSIRTISTAQITYSAFYGGFAGDLAKLGAPGAGLPPDQNAADLLDWVLGCAAQPCSKSGYNFAIVDVQGNPVSSFRSTAVPTIPGQTGFRGFCADQLSTITFDPDGGDNCVEVVQ